MINMLRELLRIIHQDGLYNPNELAKRLGASTELVDQMLLDLENSGRIKNVSTCQSNACTGCPLSASCQDKIHRVWSVKVQ
jgi:predicted transcriptional regulator